MSQTNSGILPSVMPPQRRHDVHPWIPILPPELMADRHHLNRIVRPAGVLHACDHARRRQEEHDDDQHGHNRPRELHLVAPIHLRGLWLVVSSAAE